MNNGATANHSATFKVKHLDYTKLPDDVKVVYLHKNDSKCIVKDDIKIVQNELTDNSRGRQQKLNFVEFLQARWTYLLYAQFIKRQKLNSVRPTSTYVQSSPSTYLSTEL